MDAVHCSIRIHKICLCFSVDSIYFRGIWHSTRMASDMVYVGLLCFLVAVLFDGQVQDIES